MLWKWFPWRYVVKSMARRRGFLDPIQVLAQTQNFMQPSEVTAPTELLRLGVVLHARGLMNSLAIQHNPDWVWPFWAECQYNPHNEAFIPRAFSLTQINLTHRNWTALAVPASDKFAIVDPRGLVTPHYDGWSIDAWILLPEGTGLIPSRLSSVEQKYLINGNPAVITCSCLGEVKLQSKADVIGSALAPMCRIMISAVAPQDSWLVVSVRPYNPEGVSFVYDIALNDDRLGFKVNKKQDIFFNVPVDQCEFSYYRHGDVYSRLPSQEDKKSVWCKVGMATAAAMYKLNGHLQRDISVEVPLLDFPFTKESHEHYAPSAEQAWDQSLEGRCLLQIPDKQFQFLYDAAVKTLILHSPKEIYPGPFLYKRFWFRDAAFMLKALLSAGFKKRAAQVMECFFSKQKADGYFLSQEGEWDSNGQALWIMQQYCAMTGECPPADWKKAVIRAGRWIKQKRLPSGTALDHAGLFPAGFSAEHFGPNDFYYWDDFWGVAGLKAAASLCKAYQEQALAGDFEAEARKFAAGIDASLELAARRLRRPAMPASPYRRLDTAAIGCLAADYPLRLWKTGDPRMKDTVKFLMDHCLIKNGFFHDMAHSGINPYLTLHLAQVLLRAGDPRYFDLMGAIAELASPTGQWPEAIHPLTGSGCMGDGQHAWASAEWVMIIRNCFVREEEGRLILCSGIPQAWLEWKMPMAFGWAPTEFGDISINITFEQGKPCVSWKGQWHKEAPAVEVRL